MSKVYRYSQIRKLVGERAGGLELCKLGLPYDGASGFFLPNYPDRMAMLFALIEQHPELHIMSKISRDGLLVNRYESDACYYFAYYGNADPTLEFNEETSDEDFTPEELAESQRCRDEFFNNPWSPTQIAAVNWMINRMVTRNKADEE